ncbi:endonuclease/exonuclease/phosphatase family protein [Bizionia psychrotolerans]|uniref:endonuclease/exonuclease/phosphatase family protein n=1 Tax=Bizionia psychrotolerans TaxID=1492901 RepID=UPI00065038B8|nr:endonuclease/exonuclease/phosphatase family protein [Bizionia psychrotolerans]
MMKLKKIIKFTLYLIAIVVAICSMLSVFRNAEIRYLKMLDFPRIQLFILSFICFLWLSFTLKNRPWYKILAIIGLLFGLLINGSFIINYTPLVPEQVPTAKEITSPKNQLSLLIANVKMSNKNADLLINLIETKKPDLVLAMETDTWWNKQLKVLKDDYPYNQKAINEVTYGMILFSKFPLKNVKINYLNNEKVPSFESSILLTNNRTISLHCLHPVPPTHFEELPDNASQDENAMKKLGSLIEKRKYPTIVAGDLNDVVWSYVDDLTNTENLLYDVRVGRGFYNSYNAENILMRWPLDHIFVTEEFHLNKIERLSKIGSDHFPIYVELVLSK